MVSAPHTFRVLFQNPGLSRSLIFSAILVKSTPLIVGLPYIAIALDRVKVLPISRGCFPATDPPLHSCLFFLSQTLPISFHLSLGTPGFFMSRVFVGIGGSCDGTS